MGYLALIAALIVGTILGWNLSKPPEGYEDLIKERDDLREAVERLDDNDGRGPDGRLREKSYDRHQRTGR